MTNDAVTQDFVVQTDDSNDVGIYTVTVECTIQVPDDYTKTSYTEWKQSDTFTIIVQPCKPDMVDAT